jgi:predicted nucleic acid-binding protein
VTMPFIDTDIIIRLLTGDDPRKQVRARMLFEQVEAGTLAVAAPDTVIADAVFVLSSNRLYRKSHREVAALLTPLVRLTGLRIANRHTVLAALQLYGDMPRLDFGDAMIAAARTQAASDVVYSYDKDFDDLPGVVRQEP